ncbi:hypothetical protein UFOVP1326_2 [uncultured Caudovirales phage]|uniref:Uncharacterized protein n=1 Tax=uncultured Caudovirales phage TaxID=2100421 RepID=A0A6J5RYK1_9CAUD|nr:hypothetical protein UFOVP1326_2 [uncultured Caudovirales phage]CAB4212828.1 hypothetical protein UFOVP1436_37 [uncultured Caudovirales phage]
MVENEDYKAGPFTGNGVATSFAFTFRCFEEADIVATLLVIATGVESTLVLTTDYTVTLNADQDTNPGGTVTYNPSGTPMASTHKLTLTRDLAFTQTTDLRNSGAGYRHTIETMVDRVTVLTQQVNELLARSLRYPVSDPSLTIELPAAAQRAGEYAAFDSSGNLITSGAPAGGVAVSSYMETVVAAANAAAARTLLGTGAGDTTAAGTNAFTGANSFLDSQLTIKGNVDATKLAVFDTDNAMATGTTEKVKLTGRETIWIPAGAMTARTTNGAASGTAESTTNKIMLRTLDFDAGTAEYAQFAVTMPKSWNEGTLKVQFIWSNAAGTGDVVWGCQGVAISDDDVIDATFGTAQTVTDSVTAAGDLMKSAETAAITVAGTPVAGDTVVLQFYRDAASGSDTFATDARLHGVLVFFSTDAANDV